MKKNFLTLFLISSVLSCCINSVFASDTKIYNKFVENKIIEKKDDYKLNNHITRYEAVKLIANVSGYFENNEDYSNIKKLGNFVDASSEQEYYLGVAVKLGIIRPNLSRTIKPNEEITKQEFGRYLLRLLAIKESVDLKEELTKYGVNTDKIDNNLNIYEACDMLFNILDEEVQNGLKDTYIEKLVKNGLVNKDLIKKLEIKYKKINDKDIHILYFNDFHGAITEEITGRRRNIGMSKMVNYVNEFVKKYPNTIILSGGDNYQGTVDSNLTYGKPVSKMFKNMNITASAVGSHEFDWGIDKISNWSKEGNVTFLANNIYDIKTKKLVNWAKPYIIKEINGKKIAIIGIAHPDTKILTKSENVKDIKFLNPVKTTKKWVKYLNSGKAEEGKPDIIIALTHIDSVQNNENNEITGGVVELANNVEGIDLILSSQSHMEVNGEVNNIKVVQAPSSGRGISIINITESNDIITKIYNTIDIKDTINTNKDIDVYYNNLQKKLTKIKNTIIGEIKEPLLHGKEYNGSNSLLGRWTSETIKDKMNVDLVINNGGLFRRTLEKGNVTMGDMYEIAPFDNTLVTLKMKGKDIKEILNHGIMMPKTIDGQFYGMKVYYDSKMPYENKIVKLETLDGKEVDMEKYYTLCINEFILSGGDGYNFSKAVDIKDTKIVLRDILIEKIKQEQVILPKEIDYIKDIN